VLHVVPSFYPAHGYGGPVSALYELCRAQRAGGLDVKVLTSDASGPSRLSALSGRWVTELGVPTFYAPVRLGEDLAPSLLWRIARELHWADLLHISGLWSGASLLALGEARLCSKPTVLSPHGALMPWALDSGRGRQRKLQVLRLLRPLLNRLAGWHVSSEAEAAGLRELTQLGHLPSGIPIGLVEHGVRPEQIVPPTQPRAAQIVVLGRVHPVKNLELALRSFAVLRATRPQARLILAGPTPDAHYLAQLKTLADSLGSGDSVQWPGLLGPTEKTQLLSESSVLWLCSHMESFGLVVVEALAAGTPVIAVEGTPWQVLPRAAVGDLVSPQASAVAAATERVLSQPLAEREAQQARCQRFVAEHYTWPVLEARLRAFYQQVTALAAR
jgi:glycosyltransferase involved in cell wall biosynthesis